MLVITIIVLLILAGISIQMLSGENGILNQVGDAPWIYNEYTITASGEVKKGTSSEDRDTDTSNGEENNDGTGNDIILTSDICNIGGATYFSDTNYWYDSEESKFKDDYVAKNNYVYDSNSKLHKYITKYSEYLNTTARVEVSVPSYEDIKDLDTSIKNCGTYYWLGSTRYEESIYYVTSSGGIDPGNIYHVLQCVRPVIIF